MNAPTPTTYSGWQAAYDHYNTTLFGGALPPCLITLQRKDHRCAGYYSANRFGHMRSEGVTTDEIALNPQHFKVLGVQEALQTLVHEMTHLWQHHHGKTSRKGYHNTEWADRLEAIGLMPSSTGKPGGQRTGQQMGDYAIEGGPFLAATRQLLDTGWELDWYDRIAELIAEQMPEPPAMLLSPVSGAPIQAPAPKPNRARRTKYTCPKCEARAWGGSKLAIKCTPCDTGMLAE